jgi:hypothetical protein
VSWQCKEGSGHVALILVTRRPCTHTTKSIGRQQFHASRRGGYFRSHAQVASYFLDFTISFPSIMRASELHIANIIIPFSTPSSIGALQLIVHSKLILAHLSQLHPIIIPPIQSILQITDTCTAQNHCNQHSTRRHQYLLCAQWFRPFAPQQNFSCTRQLPAPHIKPTAPISTSAYAPMTLSGAKLAFMWLN